MSRGSARLPFPIAAFAAVLISGSPSAAAPVPTVLAAADRLPGVSFARIDQDEAPSRVAVRFERLEAGDRIVVSAPAGAFVPPAGDAGAWHTVVAAEPKRPGEWSRPAPVGDFGLVLEVGPLAPDEGISVSAVRPTADGELRASRSIGRTSAGALVVSDRQVSASRRMVHLVGVDGAYLPGGDRSDAAGDLRLPETDPALAFLRPHARSVDRYVEVTGARSVSPDSSLFVETDNNADYSGYPCSNNFYWGSAITVSAAPTGATITSFDITQWRAYHSDDISDFKLMFWNADSGGSWNASTAFVVYNGTSTGSQWITSSMLGIHNFDGISVNRKYMLSGCNKKAGTTAYLDYYSLTIYYGASATVDLVADGVAVSGSPVAAGGTVQGTFSGHVGGTGSVSAPFSVGFYLSADATVTTSDTLLLRQTSAWATAAGQNFGIGSPGLTLTIPSSVVPGTYTVGVIVDDTSVIAETTEGNNVATTTLTVAPAGSQPNLQATGCSLSASTAVAGDTLTFTWSGSNSGVIASAPFAWGVYLSADATISSTDTLLAGLDAPGGWAAGSSTGNVATSITLPASLGSGTWYVGILLDSGSAVAETNENDNSCSKPLTVGGAGSGSATWLIPAAASAAGAGGSNWKTQISVANPGTAARTANLYYVAAGQPWPGVLLSGPRSIAAGEAWYLDDPLLALAPTAGLVYLVVDAPGLLPTSRTYNLDSGGGTFGQGIPAIPLDSAVAPTEFVFPMIHSRSGRYRANLGIVQTGSGGGTLTVGVDVFTATGTLVASGSFSSSAAYRQVNDLFGELGVGGVSVEGGWVRIRKTGGAPTYWTTYLSIVDFDTNDPTYESPMVP